MHRVFVYGTLRHGFGNHRLLLESNYLGNHKTEPEYNMVSLGAYPAVLPNGITSIVGEVYEVNDEVFQRLDQLEGYPSLYDRMEINTNWGPAWMYFMNDQDLQRFRSRPADVVQSGDWRKFKHMY